MISTTYILDTLIKAGHDGRPEVSIWTLLSLLKRLEVKGTYSMARVTSFYSDKVHDQVLGRYA